MDPRSSSLFALYCAFSLATCSAAFAADATDELINSLKPGVGENSASAQAKCRKLSDEARSHNVKVLVIAFEGLLSYSAPAVRQAYRYQWELAHGHQASRPGGALAGFVVSGLMVPMVEKYKGKFEFIAFPYNTQSDHEGSVPEICALEWLKVPGRKLMITGHSFGGDATVQLANQLEQRSIKVNTVMTLDAVPKSPRLPGVIHTTRNADHWINFYQRNFMPFGKNIADSPVNMQLHVMHTSVPFQPEVFNAFTSRLEQILDR